MNVFHPDGGYPKAPLRDTISQKLGRLSIVVSGQALLIILAGSLKSLSSSPGTADWWAELLGLAFRSAWYRWIAWGALGTFLLGNILNLASLQRENGLPRFSIGGGMTGVLTVAIICLGLREAPMLGLCLILMVSLMPAYVVRHARRRRRKGRDPIDQGLPRS